jgi:hypothetical protein
MEPKAPQVNQLTGRRVLLSIHSGKFSLPTSALSPSALVGKA